MVHFHESKIALTESQVHKLHQGQTIRIKHEQLGHGHSVHLLKTQLTKVNSSHRHGKGCTLEFSNDQIQHHKLHGSGIVSDLFRSGVKFVKGKALDAADALGSYGIGKAIEMVREPLANAAPSLLKPFVNMGLDMGQQYSKEQLHSMIHGMKGGALYAPGYGHQ